MTADPARLLRMAEEAEKLGLTKLRIWPLGDESAAALRAHAALTERVAKALALYRDRQIEAGAALFAIEAALRGDGAL